MHISVLNVRTLRFFIVSRIDKLMEDLKAKLETAYEASGNRKIDIISHSMGGLLVSCFISLHADVCILFSWWQVISNFMELRGQKYSPFIFHNYIIDFNLFIDRCSQNLLTSGSVLHALSKVPFSHSMLLTLVLQNQQSVRLCGMMDSFNLYSNLKHFSLSEAIMPSSYLLSLVNSLSYYVTVMLLCSR